MNASTLAAPAAIDSTCVPLVSPAEAAVTVTEPGVVPLK